MKSVFSENIPVYDMFLSEKLYEYYNRIYRSVCMDHIRWYGYEDYGDSIRSGYKHLIYFLYNRIKYLTSVYGGTLTAQPPSIYDDSTHILTFVFADGSTEEMTVMDGTLLRQEELPGYDESLYDGWRLDDESLSYLSCYDPIFEDRTLVLNYK